MTTNRNIRPALIGALLTIPSVWLVIAGAQNEPYVAPTPFDAFTQIGVACSLITGWILFVLWLVAQIRCRHLAALWSATILWTLIAIFYLQENLFGYLSDLMQFHGVK